MHEMSDTYSETSLAHILLSKYNQKSDNIKQIYKYHWNYFHTFNYKFPVQCNTSSCGSEESK